MPDIEDWEDVAEVAGLTGVPTHMVANAPEDDDPRQNIDPWDERNKHDRPKEDT